MPPSPMLVCDKCDGGPPGRKRMCRAAGPRGQGDREAEPGGQGNAEAWDSRVSRSEETRMPGQEYRGAARSLIGPGCWVAKTVQKRKKKGGRWPKGLFGRRLEERCGFILVVPSTAPPRDLASSQTDKLTPLPPGHLSEELGRCVKGEEVARTDDGNEDNVVVARGSCTTHPRRQGAHNLSRSGKDPIVWHLRAA